jgi:HSP20 family protein
MRSYCLNQSCKCSVYPGEYIPLLNTEELMAELKRPHEGIVVRPHINISEERELVKIEVDIPGLRREDFFINIENNILSIAVLHKKFNAKHKERFQLHEFNYECFNRHIILPENVDTEFVSAEYKTGILKMYLPKTDYPSKLTSAQVIVY